MARVEQAGPAAFAPEVEATVAEPVSVQTTALLPTPASQGGFGVELAILWVRSLQGDRDARRVEARFEEHAMLRAGRSRVEELRVEARSAWRGAIARGVGGMVGGALQVGAACCPAGGAPPGSGAKVDRRSVLTGGGKLFESSMNLVGGYYDQQAGEHGATAEARRSAQEVAQQHAARSREAQGDAADDISRTIELMSELLAASNAAQGAAILRG